MLLKLKKYEMYEKNRIFSNVCRKLCLYERSGVEMQRNRKFIASAEYSKQAGI
jgi:hypothetical protein